MKKLAIMALVAAAASSAWAVKGTIVTDKGARCVGEISWQQRAKKYIIATKKGPTVINSEYTVEQVAELDIPKPDNFDNAVATKNIPALKKIVEEYRMLTWDKPAGNALVYAYLQSHPANPQEAYNVARKIIEADEKAAYMGDLAPAYWQSLLALGKKQNLENCLNKATNAGDRRSAAEAMIMRGDIIAKEDTAEAHRRALIDGYLRVALLCTDSECRASRKAALLRCSESFKKCHMSTRAAEMRALADQITL